MMAFTLFGLAKFTSAAANDQGGVWLSSGDVRGDRLERCPSANHLLTNLAWLVCLALPRLRIDSVDNLG